VVIVWESKYLELMGISSKCIFFVSFVNYVIYVPLLLRLCILIVRLYIFIVMYVLYSVSLCCFVYCLCVKVYLQLPPGLKPFAVNKIYQYAINMSILLFCQKHLK